MLRRGLIRQAERGYDMNCQADIHYDERGTDNVKIMEAYGCIGPRGDRARDITPSIEWARK